MSIDVIIVHGSPGNGKTTISKKLHEHFKSPYFEFGWIPEFRNLTPALTLSPKEEEQLSFENLMFVIKNYAKYGYKNIIVTDFDDVRMLDLPVEFANYNYIIITLYSEDEDVIRERIMNRDNGNQYKDCETSIQTNRLIRNRAMLPNEYRLQNCNLDIESCLQEIVNLVHNHIPSKIIKNDLKREEFYSYIRDRDT